MSIPGCRWITYDGHQGLRKSGEHFDLVSVYHPRLSNNVQLVYHRGRLVLQVKRTKTDWDYQAALLKAYAEGLAAKELLDL